MSDKIRRVHMGCRIPEALKAGLENAAAQRGTTLSDLVVACLFTRMVAEGFMTADGAVVEPPNSLTQEARKAEA